MAEGSADEPAYLPVVALAKSGRASQTLLFPTGGGGGSPPRSDSGSGALRALAPFDSNLLPKFNARRHEFCQSGGGGSRTHKPLFKRLQFSKLLAYHSPHSSNSILIYTLFRYFFNSFLLCVPTREKYRSILLLPSSHISLRLHNLGFIPRSFKI